MMIQTRKNLSKLIQELGEIFTVSTAASTLGISNREAAKSLSRWSVQGRLTRIAERSLYHSSY